MGHPIFPLTPPLSAAGFGLRTRQGSGRCASLLQSIQGLTKPVRKWPVESSKIENSMIFLLQPDTLSAARETQQGNESRKHN